MPSGSKGARRARRPPLPHRLPQLRARRARARARAPRCSSGRNGQGKTNLVESIGYLSTLGSHRVSGDQAAHPGRRGCRDRPRSALARRPRAARRAAAQPPGCQSRPAEPLSGEDPRAAALRAQRAVRPRGPRDRARRAVGAPAHARRAARAAHPAPRGRDGRLRAGAQAAQLAAEERSGPRALGRQAADARHLGRTARRARLRAHRPACCPHRRARGPAGGGLPLDRRRRPRPGVAPVALHRRCRPRR